MLDFVKPHYRRVWKVDPCASREPAQLPLTAFISQANANIKYFDPKWLKLVTCASETWDLDGLCTRDFSIQCKPNGAFEYEMPLELYD